MSLRLVFLGTGEFALPTFRALYDTEHSVAGLVTQPDRTGSGHHQHRNPLKELALEHQTTVLQPVKANAPESLEQFRALNADLFVVAAYGQILSAELLGIPRLGAINLHASLLPKYRGAAPIQYAVINGETETGITIFQIEPKLDAGPILGVVSTPIDERETYGELQDRLAQLAVPLAVNVINQLASGTSHPQHQDVSQVTRAPRLKKEDGDIQWARTARLVSCQVRGVQPWPKPVTVLQTADGRTSRLLILEVLPTAHDWPAGLSTEPGTIDIVDRKRLFVRTGDGCVEVLRLQPEGRRAMTPAELINGHRLAPGDRFVSVAS